MSRENNVMLIVLFLCVEELTKYETLGLQMQDITLRLKSTFRRKPSRFYSGQRGQPELNGNAVTQMPHTHIL
jgi:hypothetical protein